jgi:hypothetical protein
MDAIRGLASVLGAGRPTDGHCGAVRLAAVGSVEVRGGHGKRYVRCDGGTSANAGDGVDPDFIAHSSEPPGQ